MHRESRVEAGRQGHPDTARLIMAGTPTYTEQRAEADQMVHHEVYCPDTQALGIVPLFHVDGVIGGLEVRSHRLAQVPALGCKALEAVAAQLSSAIPRGCIGVALPIAACFARLGPSWPWPLTAEHWASALARGVAV